jgi:hypothetical protein
MTPVYHITCIKNLPGIIQQKGLFCDSEKNQRNIEAVSIAYTALKERRAKTVVPVSKGGTLSDYVPFYFCTRSPLKELWNRKLINRRWLSNVVGIIINIRSMA